MRLQSSLVCCLLLIAIASYCVSLAVVLDDEVGRKLKANLFRIPSIQSAEEVTYTMKDGEREEEQGEFVNKINDAGRGKDAVVPAGSVSFDKGSVVPFEGLVMVFEESSENLGK